MIYEYSDYREFLKDTLIARQKRNKLYSMRAFAKALGLPASTLSEIINRRKNISSDAAKKISGGLRLRRFESHYFDLLVEKSSTKDSRRINDIHAELISVAHQGRRPVLEPEQDPFLNQATKFILIELGGVENFVLNSATGAKAIGCSEDVTSALLVDLAALGILTYSAESDRYQKSGAGVLISSEKMNLDLRKFHFEMLDKAKASLIQQSPQERLIGSETFSFNSDQISEANDIMEEFFSKMVSLANRGNNKNSVYHVGLQMFRLAKVGTDL